MKLTHLLAINHVCKIVALGLIFGLDLIAKNNGDYWKRFLLQVTMSLKIPLAFRT
jgi:hypothetical protein